MTTKEFNSIFYSKNDKVRYKGETYPILSINFDNHLIGIQIEGNGIKEVHCEELIYLRNTSNDKEIKMNF